MGFREPSTESRDPVATTFIVFQGRVRRGVIILKTEVQVEVSGAYGTAQTLFTTAALGEPVSVDFDDLAAMPTKVDLPPCPPSFVFYVCKLCLV